jgi:hypothetical protein
MAGDARAGRRDAAREKAPSWVREALAGASGKHRGERDDERGQTHARGARSRTLRRREKVFARESTSGNRCSGTTVSIVDRRHGRGRLLLRRRRPPRARARSHPVEALRRAWVYVWTCFRDVPSTDTDWLIEDALQERPRGCARLDQQMRSTWRISRVAFLRQWWAESAAHTWRVDYKRAVVLTPIVARLACWPRARGGALCSARTAHNSRGGANARHRRQRPRARGLRGDRMPRRRDRDAQPRDARASPERGLRVDRHRGRGRARSARGGATGQTARTVRMVRVQGRHGGAQPEATPVARCGRRLRGA